MCSEKSQCKPYISHQLPLSFDAWLHRINIGPETAVMTGQRTYKT